MVSDSSLNQATSQGRRPLAAATARAASTQSSLCVPLKYYLLEGPWKAPGNRGLAGACGTTASTPEHRENCMERCKERAWHSASLSPLNRTTSNPSHRVPGFQNSTEAVLQGCNLKTIHEPSRRALLQRKAWVTDGSMHIALGDPKAMVEPTG